MLKIELERRLKNAVEKIENLEAVAANAEESALRVAHLEGYIERVREMDGRKEAGLQSNYVLGSTSSPYAPSLMTTSTGKSFL